MKTLGHGFAVLMALSTAACGGGLATGDDDDGSTPPPQMSEQQAQKAGGSISSGAEFGAKSYDLRANAAFACPNVTSLGDQDGDGIPDLAAMEYVDCPVSSPWGAAILNGDAAIQDTQPTVAGVDATIAQDFVFAVTGTAGVMVDYQVVQQLSQDGAAFEINEPSVVVESGPGYSYRQENAWTKRYTPASAWQPGDAIVAGSYEVNGAFQHTSDANGTITVFEGVIATEVPLQLDPACPTLIVGGTLQAIVGDANNHQILDITWTACDASNTDLVPAP